MFTFNLMCILISTCAMWCHTMAYSGGSTLCWELYQLTPTRHCCGSCQSPLPGRYQLYINTIPFMKYIHTTMISSPPYITTPLTGPLLNHVCYYGTHAHVYHKYLTSQPPTIQINQSLYATTEHLNIYIIYVPVQFQKQNGDLPL